MNAPLSLHELNGLIRQWLQTGFADTYWLQAELSDVRANGSGHCYVEFVQKDATGNHLIAKARGTIWSGVYRLLKPYFEEATGQPFQAGLKVLVEVSVEYHELYGLSLTVHDIDPTYTVGDLLRRRREILRRLADEGILDMNRELPMPLLPQRIAIVSSATAAGYGDFMNQLTANRRGLRFHTQLFPALMQGDKTEESIIQSLDAICREQELWDAVVIIRGGGATSDLSGFDTYTLAAHVAQFPLPIITGIGHERDDTVIDSVAHTRVKTPTAAAEYLIGCLTETADRVETLALTLSGAVAARIEHERHRIERLAERIPLHIQVSIDRKRHRIDLLEQQLMLADPQRLLQRGYSITLHHGKAVTDASTLHAGDEVVTRLAQGNLTSIIQNIPI